MAQGRFRQPQRAARGGESAPIDHLHEVVEVVEIEHGAIHRPMDWMMVSIFAGFLSGCPATSLRPLRAPTAPGPRPEALMQRRRFLQSATLGAAATIVGTVPFGVAALPTSTRE